MFHHQSSLGFGVDEKPMGIEVFAIFEDKPSLLEPDLAILRTRVQGEITGDGDTEYCYGCGGRWRNLMEKVGLNRVVWPVDM